MTSVGPIRLSESNKKLVELLTVLWQSIDETYTPEDAVHLIFAELRRVSEKNRWSEHLPPDAEIQSVIKTFLDERIAYTARQAKWLKIAAERRREQGG